MNYKTFNKVNISLITGLFLLIAINNVSATVGGPATIDRLSYKPSDNSLYYLRKDGGGRGCPPIIEKIDLLTKEQIQVKTCDEIESTYYKGENSNDAYNQFIEEVFNYDSIKTLVNISFTKNNISIVVEYIGERKIDDYNTSSSFRATISQNNSPKGVIEFIGCYKDQPNVFKGFMIPNTNKLAVEISRIGECFEGGYTRDDVYVIDSIDYQDTDSVGYVNYFSEPGVHRGNLVVFAGDHNTATTSTDSNQKMGEKAEPTQAVSWVLVLIIGLMGGFIVGYTTKFTTLKNILSKQEK